MVFSLFGRKDKSDARRVRGGLPARVPDSTLRGPATQPSVEAQRELARRTAEKIDRIESEMIAAPPAVSRAEAPTQPMSEPRRVPSFGQSAMPQPAPARPSAVDPFPPAGSAAPAPIELPAAQPELEPLEFERDLAPGRPAAAGIQVSGSSLPPDLEEAAILYANGQAQAAAATLRASIARGGRDADALQAWRMLFDVLQSAGTRAEFEAVALEYAARFEVSPPAWQECAAEALPSRRPASASASIVLPPSLDASVHAKLEAVQRSGASRRPVSFDFSGVRSVDPHGAALVVSAIAGLEKAGRELSVAGAQALAVAARAAIETGRRDPGDGCWQLALLALRLLGDRQAFDDLSIDFCITYEVSPPPWEPLPASFKADADGAAPIAVPSPEAGPGPAPADRAEEGAAGFVLRGEITGRMGAELEAMRAWADGRREVQVDCRALRRLDFVAAGELLNEVLMQCSAGREVRFFEPGAMVESLLVVMGIHELAEIRRRRI